MTGALLQEAMRPRALGIPMGAPYHEWKPFLEANNVHVASSNYCLYADLSTRISNILSRYCPNIEIYSIDESFLCFEGFDYYRLEDYASEIKTFVHRATGIPVSIGIGPSKALAKAANRVAKKFPEKTKGVYFIDTEEKRIRALKWIKIPDVWGIGRQYSKMLEQYSVHTALDFTLLPDSFVRQKMTITGLRLKHDLMGKPSIQMEEVQDKKGIACTRSFAGMISDYWEVRERISTYAGVCAQKLRKQKSDCNLIYVFIRTNPFREDLPNYSRSYCIRLPFPTNSTIELTKYSVSALNKIFKKGYHYKKAGVMVMGITPSERKQLNLFYNSNPKHLQLHKVVDRINLLNGYDLVRFGGQDLKKKWKMNRNMLSPRYTSKIDEIIKINARN